MKHIDLLQSLDACGEAITYAKTRRTLKTAWTNCERGDWLLWLAGRLGIDRKLLVRAACDCARLAMKYTTDPRPLRAIETAEAWCDGQATLEEVRDAARAAAYATAYAADAAYAAARAAAYAAYAAAAARAAAYAAYAAYPSDAADADARKQTLTQCAELVRARIPWSVIADAAGRFELAKGGE
jgi:hypothetical protein